MCVCTTCISPKIMYRDWGRISEEAQYENSDRVYWVLPWTASGCVLRSTQGVAVTFPSLHAPSLWLRSCRRLQLPLPEHKCTGSHTCHLKSGVNTNTQDITDLARYIMFYLLCGLFEPLLLLPKQIVFNLVQGSWQSRVASSRCSFSDSVIIMCIHRTESLWV